MRQTGYTYTLKKKKRIQSQSSWDERKNGNKRKSFQKQTKLPTPRTFSDFWEFCNFLDLRKFCNFTIIKNQSSG